MGDDTTEQDAQAAGSRGESSELTQAVATLFSLVLRRGRGELKRAAEVGRARLELRQLRRDRALLYEKLGREAASLVEAGEISHPGLHKGVQRIRALEADLAREERERTAESSHGEE